MRGKERLSAAANALTQAPVGDGSFRYKQGSRPSKSGIRMTTTSRTRQTPRVEDNALVRGAGRFMDDPRLPNTAYAVFVRSPHAHARIVAAIAGSDAAAAGAAMAAHFDEAIRLVSQEVKEATEA